MTYAFSRARAWFDLVTGWSRNVYVWRFRMLWLWLCLLSRLLFFFVLFWLLLLLLWLGPFCRAGGGPSAGQAHGALLQGRWGPFCKARVTLLQGQGWVPFCRAGGGDPSAGL